MGRKILITGATSGLGRALTLELLKLGHRVFASGRTREGLDALLRDCEAQHLPLTGARVIDVTRPEDFDQGRKQVNENFSGDGLSRIDTLIVNAAVHLEHPHDHEGIPYVEWPHAEIRERTFAVNYHGALRTVETFLPLVRESADGRILFVNGTLGSFGWHHHENLAYREMLGIHGPEYAASKAALNMAMVHKARQEPSLFVASLFPGWLATRIGGKGTRAQGQRSVETALPFMTKYAAGEIDRTRSGQFISWLGEKSIAW